MAFSSSVQNARESFILMGNRVLPLKVPTRVANFSENEHESSDKNYDSFRALITIFRMESK